MRDRKRVPRPPARMAPATFASGSAIIVPLRNVMPPAQNRRIKMKIKIRKRIKSKSRSKSMIQLAGRLFRPTLNPYLALNPLPNLNLHPNLSLLSDALRGVLEQGTAHHAVALEQLLNAVV